MTPLDAYLADFKLFLKVLKREVHIAVLASLGQKSLQNAVTVLIEAAVCLDAVTSYDVVRIVGGPRRHWFAHVSSPID